MQPRADCADVVGSLPKAIAEKGNDCRIEVIPLYKSRKAGTS